MTHTGITFKLLATALGMAMLYGCATPATQQAMSITYGDSAKAPEQLQGQFTVRQVTGGKDTNPLWTSQVDNAGFRNALVQSLNVAGYGAGATGGTKYMIDAELQELKQPLLGFTFDVVSTVNYTVEGGGNKTVIPITATGTATTSDAFVGMERLRMANERSIKENIKAFLKALSQQF